MPAERTPKEQELKRIREQEEAMQKEIRTSLALREQMNELKEDMDETSKQLRAVAENAGNLSLRSHEAFRTLQHELRVGTNKLLVVGDFSYRLQTRNYTLSWEEAWDAIRYVLNRLEKKIHCRVDVEGSWYRRQLPGLDSSSQYVLLQFSRASDAAMMRYSLASEKHYFRIYPRGQRVRHERLKILNYTDILEAERQIPLLAAQTAFEMKNPSTSFQKKYRIDVYKKCIFSLKTGQPEFKIEYSLSGHLPLARCLVVNDFMDPIWYHWNEAMKRHYGADELEPALKLQQGDADDENPRKKTRLSMDMPLNAQPHCESAVVKHGDFRDQTTGRQLTNLYISSFPYAILFLDKHEFFRKR